MRELKLILIILSIIITPNLLWGKSYKEAKNDKDFGLLLGDPMAISVKLPVNVRNFWDFRAGIWTWHFWHDKKYNTPYLSMDYGWFFPLENSPHYFYTGIGLVFFFLTIPKM
ncbi:MAG: hypothetical protein KJ887_06165 [Candidatus Omnitrophica bacterium]|nr:hypothetical protein [Candidatus Omnitrophota bacterium]MBU1047991.1 hypothetical protein [Candidatus Omnitrophota bacterium]MBU1630689.1 hypothetical protein [Candidatus Omnitrophota bacterium]MBU1767166.1 hypothetical protein [Candidatus Omnitrophota bacterium]MBU1889631.1 hypothetical protein [Candidatus Omnitrophota bacterium]